MIDTNNLHNAIRHGEVLIVPVTDIPADAVEIETAKEVIVGHSETGHHHVITGLATVYRPKGADAQDLFVRVTEPSQLRHLKTFDVHKTFDVPVGAYLVRGKNEYDLFADELRRVRD